jgi:hypothetical protein
MVRAMPTISEILEEMVCPRIERATSENEAKRLSAQLRKISEHFDQITPEQVTAAMLEDYRRQNAWDDRRDGSKTPSRCSQDLRLMQKAVLTYSRHHHTPAPEFFERFWRW